MALSFEKADKLKQDLMDSQKKEIEALYKSWSDDLAKKAKKYAASSAPSSELAEKQTKILMKQMKATGQQVSNEVYNKIKSNMYVISDEVVKNNKSWLHSLGFKDKGLNAAFGSVPDTVVKNLVTGKIYDTGWSLSKSIWSSNEETMKSAYGIVAKGLAENSPIAEIAKELSQLVNPNAAKSWNPVIAMKNTKTGEMEFKRIYKRKVDYNAQRLARTLVQHSYQQSVVAAAEKNPLITKFIWHSNGSRACELCQDRDGKEYEKDSLPMDHPNGMCFIEPVVDKDMVNKLADWFNSEDGTYPELDEFAKEFGYEAKPKTSIYVDPNNLAVKLGISEEAIKLSPNYDDVYEWLLDLDIDVDSMVDKIAFDDLPKLLKDAQNLAFSSTEVKPVKTIMEPITKPVMSDTLSKYNLSKKTIDAALNSKDCMEWLTNASLNDFNKLLEATMMDPSLKLEELYNEAKAFKTAEAQYLKSLKSNIVSSTKVASSTKVYDPFSEDVDRWLIDMKKNDLSIMNEWCAEWKATVSPEELEGVVRYTGSSYRQMNNILRFGHEYDADMQERMIKRINDCEAALAKAKLPEQVIARRGSDYNVLKELGFGQQMTEAEVKSVIGGLVEEKGFLSTSPDPQGGFTWYDYEYVIKVPEGSQAMYVDSISMNRGEKELLINKDGRYQITDVRLDDQGNVKQIFMTLINLQ